MTYDKKCVRKSALLDYSGCRRSNVRPTPYGLKPYRKSASWICSVRPYPPSAGREFRLCGSATVSSIPSLSGIPSLSFIHSVRKSALNPLSLEIVRPIDLILFFIQFEHKSGDSSVQILLG